MAVKVIRTKNAVIRLQLDTLRNVISPKIVVNTDTARDLGEQVRENILELVSVGKSPVKGRGRFKPYAVQRGRKGGYPETNRIRRRFPGKKTRPVNLFLDGTYLKAITQFRKRVGGIDFGLIKSSKTLDRLFKVNNEGENINVPQRKALPTGKDTFVPSIIREIKRVYLKRIRSIIRSGG